MPTSDSTDQFDPWQSLPDVPKTGGRALPLHSLDIGIIENVVPLDMQLGVLEKNSVPDVLHNALFGQPEAAEAEIKDAGGNPALVPPMQTYALVDANKAVQILDRLSVSGLEHRCLFKGDAMDDLGHVAPWLVQLEDKHKFTRNLFTTNQAGNGMWENDPGILIRSRSSLDEVWRHLRKFTKVQTEAGDWSFFRFWEDWYFPVLAARQEKLPELARLFARILRNDSLVVPHRLSGTAVLVRSARNRKAEPILLTPDLRAELKLVTLYKNIIAAADDLHELHPAEAKRYGASPKDMWPLLYDFVDEVRAAGINDPRLRARLMMLAFISHPEPWPAFIETPVWQRIKSAEERAEAMFEDYCCRLKQQHFRGGSPESVWW